MTPTYSTIVLYDICSDVFWWFGFDTKQNDCAIVGKYSGYWERYVVVWYNNNYIIQSSNKPSVVIQYDWWLTHFSQIDN